MAFTQPLIVERGARPPLALGQLRRLAAFYAKQPDDLRAESKIWEAITGTYHQTLVEALKSGSLERLGDRLAGLYDDCQLYGTELGRDYEPYAEAWSANLVTLAQAVGVAPVYNPEQPHELQLEAEPLIEAIEHELDLKLEHPGASNMPGVRVRGAFVPIKALNCAHLIHSVRGLLPSLPANVLEIGAGIGMLAYYLKHRGIYDLIDLPVMAVIQAALLIETVGPDAVWLAGEAVGRQRIRIHGLHYQAAASNLRYELIVNQDSMPEMAEAAAQRYIGLIVERLSPTGVFLSINHESLRGDQRRVMTQLDNHTELRQIRRVPFWGRAGYVEEAWKLCRSY